MKPSNHMGKLGSFPVDVTSPTRSLGLKLGIELDAREVGVAVMRDVSVSWVAAHTSELLNVLPCVE
jgi:hypothetical protein